MEHGARRRWVVRAIDPTTKKEGDLILQATDRGDVERQLADRGLSLLWAEPAPESAGSEEIVFELRALRQEVELVRNSPIIRSPRLPIWQGVLLGALLFWLVMVVVENVLGWFRDTPMMP